MTPTAADVARAPWPAQQRLQRAAAARAARLLELEHERVHVRPETPTPERTRAEAELLLARLPQDNPTDIGHRQRDLLAAAAGYTTRRP
jgi:hypothetical protein